MKLLNEDSRGSIEHVAEQADVLRIISNPGARRANHWHRQHGHWCLVVSGSITYLERPLGDTEKPTVMVYGPGAQFWTGPNMEHLMLFPEHTVFYCFSVGARDADSYATDTVPLGFQLDEQ
jgi:hypothetical protein